MSKLEEMLGGYEIPRVARVRQLFDDTRLDDPEEKIRRLWREKNIEIRPGARIAITGGSRGIAGYQVIMRTVVSLVKESGGAPFIVPAMGSHGGGTAKGADSAAGKLRDHGGDDRGSHPLVHGGGGGS